MPPRRANRSRSRHIRNGPPFAGSPDPPQDVEGNSETQADLRPKAEAEEGDDAAPPEQQEVWDAVREEQYEGEINTLLYLVILTGYE